jgi:hydrogenase nickel incorporation protein HypB
MSKPRIVEVRQNVLKKNDEIARELRQRFEQAGVYVVSLVSSPGAGKTTLLERTASALAGRHRVGVLVGDLATDRDAKRLESSGARVQQIITGTVCHLDAEMVRTALAGWDLGALDFLFLENVGNLVCPSSYDLGEAVRVVLLSVTEGEDKPLKYPTIFNSADVAMVTKVDLAEAVGFRRDDLLAALDAVRPGITVLETSARTGVGMDNWLNTIEHLRIANRPAPGPEAADQSIG